MIFLIGFILGMAGLGLLIAGEVPWLGGKRVPARTGRLVGALLIAFFPLVLLARFVVSAYEIDINADIYYWSAAAIWLILAAILLIRGVPSSGRKAARGARADRGDVRTEAVESRAASTGNPFEVPPGPQHGKAKPAPKGKNPFDFS